MVWSIPSCPFFQHWRCSGREGTQDDVILKMMPFTYFIQAWNCIFAHSEKVKILIIPCKSAFKANPLWNTEKGYTCALLLWRPAVHASVGVCLYIAGLRISGYPTPSSELLSCSQAPGGALTEVRTHFTSAIDIYFQSWMNQNSESFICIYQNTWSFIYVYSLCTRLHASECFIFVLNEPPSAFFIYTFNWGIINQPQHLLILLARPDCISLGDSFL